jgi:hypothetical protein
MKVFIFAIILITAACTKHSTSSPYYYQGDDFYVQPPCAKEAVTYLEELKEKNFGVARYTFATYGCSVYDCYLTFRINNKELNTMVVDKTTCKMKDTFN